MNENGKGGSLRQGYSFFAHVRFAFNSVPSGECILREIAIKRRAPIGKMCIRDRGICLFVAAVVFALVYANTGRRFEKRRGD